MLSVWWSGSGDSPWKMLRSYARIAFSAKLKGESLGGQIADRSSQFLFLGYKMLCKFVCNDEGCLDRRSQWTGNLSIPMIERLVNFNFDEVLE